MMLDSTQHFADMLTQEQPFGRHAVKLQGEGAHEVRATDHPSVTRLSSLQARHAHAPIRR